MTGKYIDFKGKLKVGDRVKHYYRIYPAIVKKVDDTGFWMDEHDFFPWDHEGTLELLSPSPRLVTEPAGAEDTDAGFKKMLLSFIDGYADGLDKLNAKLDEALARMGVEPIQPASQPAPAEKEEEWWAGETYMKSGFNGSGYRENLPDIPKIIAEAKRRGAEEAWKEIRAKIDSFDTEGSKSFVDSYRMSWRLLLIAVDSKLESLNKPAGAGEK